MLVDDADGDGTGSALSDNITQYADIVSQQSALRERRRTLLFTCTTICRCVYSNFLGLRDSFSVRVPCHPRSRHQPVGLSHRKKHMKCLLVVIQAVILCCLSALGACGGSGSSSKPSVEVPAVIPPVVIAPAIPIEVPVAVAPEIRILVVGQSISSNCNEKVYGASPNIFKFDLTGTAKIASDPFDWSDCKMGSMWMPLGKRLVDSGMASKVTFMPIGLGSTTVADWQAGGKAFSKLNSAIDVIKTRGISFEYAFWHQGSSDFGIDRNLYASRLLSVIGYLNRNVKIEKWLIAIHSRCFGKWDREIEAAQLAVSTTSGDNIFVGPNNNLLDDTYRFDTCHLNAKGQDEMAGLWLEAMKNAK